MRPTKLGRSYCRCLIAAFFACPLSLVHARGLSGAPTSDHVNWADSAFKLGQMVWYTGPTTTLDFGQLPGDGDDVILGHFDPVHPGEAGPPVGDSDDLLYECDYTLSTNVVLGSLILDIQNIGASNITLSQGEGTLSTQSFFIGEYGKATFQLVGGVTHTQSLAAGMSPGSFGALRVTGGSVLDIYGYTDGDGFGNLQIGQEGEGVCTVSFAQVDTGLLFIGNGGSGSFNLGTSGVLNTNITYLGGQPDGIHSGSGTFNQIDGSANLGELRLGYGESCQATYNLSGGVLTTSEEYVGGGYPFSGYTPAVGHFIQTGGLHNVQSLTVYPLSTYEMSRGTLRANSIALSGGQLTQTGGVIFCNSLDLVQNTGTLDISGGGFVIDYTSQTGSPIDSIRAEINHGNIASSGALTDPRFTLICMEASDLGASSFMGQPIDDTAVLLSCTYSGDANFDGKVDINDLIALASHWGMSASWSGGDFDGNGFVDVGDLVLLAKNWQAGVDNGSETPALAPLLASLGLPQVAVPEPANLSLLGVGLLSLRRRGQAANQALVDSTTK